MVRHIYSRVRASCWRPEVGLVCPVFFVVHEHHHIVNLQALPALSVGHHDRTDATETSRAFCGRLSVHHLGKTTYVRTWFPLSSPVGQAPLDAIDANHLVRVLRCQSRSSLEG